MYQTVLTSQGTLTLPAEVRRRHRLIPGDVLTVEDDGEIRILKAVGFADVRAKNAKFVRSVRKHTYKQGDGMAAHVRQKYGKK